MLSGAGCSFKRVRLFADHKEDQGVVLLLGNGNAELSRFRNTKILQNLVKIGRAGIDDIDQSHRDTVSLQVCIGKNVLYSLRE